MSCVTTEFHDWDKSQVRWVCLRCGKDRLAKRTAGYSYFPQERRLPRPTTPDNLYEKAWRYFWNDLRYAGQERYIRVDDKTKRLMYNQWARNRANYSELLTDDV